MQYILKKNSYFQEKYLSASELYGIQMATFVCEVHINPLSHSLCMCAYVSKSQITHRGCRAFLLSDSLLLPLSVQFCTQLFFLYTFQNYFFHMFSSFILPPDNQGFLPFTPFPPIKTPGLRPLSVF